MGNLKKLGLVLAVCVLACVVALVNKNNGVRYQYWFYDDFENAVTVRQDSSKNWNLFEHIDASSLSEGFHFLRIRHEDANGEWSSTDSLLILKFTPKATHDIKVQLCQYWLDEDLDGGLSVKPIAKDFVVNLSSENPNLSMGLHVLNFRFQDADGVWSTVTSKFFSKVVPDSMLDKKVVFCQYWVDADFDGAVSVETTLSARKITFLSNLDFENMREGLHALNMRFQEASGEWRAMKSFYFMKFAPNTMHDNNVVSCQYWLDAEFDGAVSIRPNTAQNVVFDPSLDLGKVDNGLHSLNLRYQGANGVWSSMMSRFFVKVAPKDTNDNKVALCQYWVDKDLSGALSVQPTSSQDIVFDPSNEFMKVDDGLHVLNMRFQNANGMWSPAKKRFFIKKTYKNPSGIGVFCQYWLDDNFSDTMIGAVEKEAKDEKIIDMDFCGIPADVQCINFRSMDCYGAKSANATCPSEKISLPIADFSLDKITLTCRHITLQINDNSAKVENR